MKKFLVGFAVVVLLLTSGCFSAQRARVFAINSPHTVYVYSGGKLVATYKSVGRVFPEEKSDGWYFEDAATRKLVHVAGTVVITQD